VKLLLRKLIIIAGAAGFLLGVPACLFASYESSLVGYWELDETSGSYAYDSTAYNRNGAISGATQGVPGVYGTAYSFDGSNDYVNYGTQILFNPNAFTFSAWIKPEPGMNGCRLIAYNPSTNSAITKYFDIYLSGNGLVWDLFKTGSVWDGINTNVLLSEWNHITAIYTGTGCSLYLDGALVGSKSATLAAYGNPFNTFVGNNANNMSQGPFKGLIDDIAIWNRALSADEVDVLHSSGVNVLGSSQYEYIETNYQTLNEGALDFSAQEIAQLTELYLGESPDPIIIDGMTWRYFSENKSGYDTPASWYENGHYYFQFGSGVTTEPLGGSDVPEPSTLLLLLPFIVFWLRRSQRTG